MNGKSIIETDEGVAVINREGKVLTDYFPKYTFSISDWKKSGFILKNNLVVIQEKEGLNSVILGENMNELEIDVPETKIYYFNDSLISIYRAEEKEEYRPRDFTKELPEVNSIIGGIGDFKIYISSGYLPSDLQTGYIKPETTENFFIQNFETFEHKVEVTFFYELTTYGSVKTKTKYWKTFTVVVPPNGVKIIDPSSISGLELKTFNDQYKRRNFKLAYKVDGKQQSK